MKLVNISDDAKGSRNGNDELERGAVMRETVHLCFSSHDEVLYRNEADLIMGFNCLALAALETESRLLAEGFITTHNHKLAQTDNAKELARRDRYAYSRYFNAKYSRLGRLGERTSFLLTVYGVYHTQTTLNYVIRQALHHGLVYTPFEYPHCSANSFFRKELGKVSEPELCDARQRYKYLPHGVVLPEMYKISKDGLILREQILDTAYVEQVYITPRNFLYQMNRISDERMIKEQQGENELPPITLDTIEKGVPDFDVRAALLSEQGRVNTSAMTDLELCHIIDDILLPRYLKQSDGGSIYLLNRDKRADMGNSIWREARESFGQRANGLFSNKQTSVAQIRRCLAL